LGLLPHVNRIIVVDKGRIVADGPRDQVLSRMRQPRPVAPGVQAEEAVA
jgi:energy-coupling factor transporter ATP-binding protein EcfA2